MLKLLNISLREPQSTRTAAAAKAGAIAAKDTPTEKVAPAVTNITANIRTAKNTFTESAAAITTTTAVAYTAIRKAARKRAAPKKALRA